MYKRKTVSFASGYWSMARLFRTTPIETTCPFSFFLSLSKIEDNISFELSTISFKPKLRFSIFTIQTYRYRDSYVNIVHSRKWRAQTVFTFEKVDRSSASYREEHDIIPRQCAKRGKMWTGEEKERERGKERKKDRNEIGCACMSTTEAYMEAWVHYPKAIRERERARKGLQSRSFENTVLDERESRRQGRWKTERAFGKILGSSGRWASNSFADELRDASPRRGRGRVTLPEGR